MEERYRKTKTTLSLLQYHFVFCPRYKRKIFLIEGVEKSFKEKLKKICDELEIKIIDVKFEKNYVYLQIDSLPNRSPKDIMQKIKLGTSSIKEEFEELKKMPNLWTRNFIVSYEKISEEIIKEYLKNQRVR